MSHDVNGREYLHIDDAKAGQIVELDDGFTCHGKGKVTLLADAKGELYFDCKDGGHHISGQADDGIHCIGIYP